MYATVVFERFSPNSVRLSGLWQVERPPERLYFRGRPSAFDLLERLPEAALGIVGTREPQHRSIGAIKETFLGLEGSNLIIVSGLARGIDAAAHEAALGAGLPTIAVLGSGLNKVYPRENARLADAILEAGGLLASEFPDDVPPQPAFFLRRNRFIAGWSRALWVVEAGIRSGALNSAQWATDMGREIYATPCFPEDPVFAGNQRLLDSYHARAVWGAHSFGETWLSLAARKVPVQKHSETSETPLFQQGDDKALLSSKIERLSSSKGGATADELLKWALEQNWTPKRFFLALQDSVQSRLVLEHRGSFSYVRPSRSESAT